MIISTAIQTIPVKFWKYSFVAVKVNPHHCLYFTDWTKNIAPAVKTGGTAYFWNHERSYYYDMKYPWKNMTVIKQREVMSIIDRFTTHINYPWTKKTVSSLICFVSLDQIYRIQKCHMVLSEHPEVIDRRQWLIATDVL